MDEEIDFHIEMRTRELVERGLDPKDARDIVLAPIGDLGELKRTWIDLRRKRDREMRLILWLEELRTDIRFAVRQLRSAPGFTVVAALTLALGIGANSAMFALPDATLLRPLPFGDPDVWSRGRAIREPSGGAPQRIAPLNVFDWSEQNRTVRDDGRGERASWWWRPVNDGRRRNARDRSQSDRGRAILRRLSGEADPRAHLSAGG